MKCPTCSKDILAVNMRPIHGPPERARFYLPCGHYVGRLGAWPGGPCTAPTRFGGACALEKGHEPPCVPSESSDSYEQSFRIELK